MIKQLDTIPIAEFNKIETCLAKIKIPINQANNRIGFPKFRALTLGLTKYRTDKHISCAVSNDKYPELFDAVFEFGDKYCPFKFTSVYVNNNTVCPRHKDKGNFGISMIVSLGDYTGCNLVIDEKIYDARHRPIVFDGTQLIHYNTPDLVGNKYSLVFFTIRN
jgi:hypothetical protein